MWQGSLSSHGLYLSGSYGKFTEPGSEFPPRGRRGLVCEKSVEYYFFHTINYCMGIEKRYFFTDKQGVTEIKYLYIVPYISAKMEK